MFNVMSRLRRNLPEPVATCDEQAYRTTQRKAWPRTADGVSRSGDVNQVNSAFRVDARQRKAAACRRCRHPRQGVGA